MCDFNYVITIYGILDFCARKSFITSSFGDKVKSNYSSDQEIIVRAVDFDFVRFKLAAKWRATLLARGIFFTSNRSKHR